MAEPSILGALRDPQFRSDTLRNLVEALNGAKRSLTVGSLGAVGDMGNTLANLVRAGAGTAYHEATGRPIPQALEYRDPARDFGTSASLGNFAESQGWLPPQTGSIPETAGALLGPIAAMKAPDLAQSTLRGLVSALKSEPSRRMVEGYMGGMGMKPQAIVYHGSPHQFDAFDSSKIGTGEGAQAYGHGLYLAEAKKVADEYAGKLSSKNVTIPGFSPSNSAENELLTALTARANSTQYGSAASAVMNDLWSVARHGDPTRKAAAQRMLDAMGNAGMPSILDAGSLYKVDLPDPLIARMLDWDKPLNQQAPEVKNAFRNVPAPGQGMTYGDIVDAIDAAPHLQNANDYPWAHPSGSELYRVFGEGLMTGNNSKGQAAASTKLRELGIPGIRYLDGGSRADGAGTSNFVVFPGEESALTILERNGKPVRK